MRTSLIIIFCTLSVSVFSQQWEWARQASQTNGNQVAKGVVEDNFGNVYMIGYDDTTTMYGNTSLAGGSFLAKYTNSGNLIWAKPLPGEAQALASNISGDIYVVGNFSGTINFGVSTYYSNGSRDIYIAKFGANSNLSWANTYGGTANDEVKTVKIDLSGNIYFAGSFKDSISFGTQKLKRICTNNYADGKLFFLTKLDLNGTAEWARTCPYNYGNNVWQYSTSAFLAIDKNSNIYLTGQCEDLPCPSGYCIHYFLLKYDSTGFLMANYRPWGMYESQYGLAVDDSLNIITEFHCGTHYTLCKALAKYNNQMQMKWLVPVGDYGYFNNYTFLYGLSVDAGSNIYLAGIIGASFPSYHDTTVICNDTLLTKPKMDVLVGKFDTQGNCVWVKTAGGDGEENGYDPGGASMYVGKNGDCYMAGTFNPDINAANSVNDSVPFDNDTLFTQGQWSHIYLAKLKNLQPIITKNKMSEQVFAFNVYPNPARSKLIINLNESLLHNCELEAHNLYGVKVKSVKLKGGESKTEINVEEIPEGIYFYSLKVEGKTLETKKVIIAR